MNLSLSFVEQLDQPTREALERLATEIAVGWAVEHNADGTHKGGDKGKGDVVGPASATDLHIAVYNGTTGKLIADGGTTVAALIAAAAAPHHSTHEPGGLDALVGVAWTALNNIFTGYAQAISASTPRLLLSDTGQPANSRVFDIVNVAQTLYFRSMTDDDATAIGVPPPLALTRPGDAHVGRDLYEKGRAVPMGHWTHADSVSYCQQGMTGPYSWMLLGKTLFLSISAQGTGAGGLTVSRFNFPAGCAPAIGVNSPAQVNCGAWEAGLIYFVASSPHFDIYRNSAAIYPVGVLSTVGVSIAIPIL